MTAMYGLFNSPHAAQRAYDGLRASGIPVGEIVVMSSEPLEEWEFGSQDRQTIMPWIAIIGAVAGLVIAYLLTSITQRVWPIDTGGMPIVSNWTNLVIMYEMTMLGAVLATVATLLVTARLPAKLTELYDPAVSEGKILVGTSRINGPNLANIEDVLRGARAERIRTL